MPYRPLGSTGLQASSLGLGCNTLGLLSEKIADRLIGTAIDLGVNFFDTAATYGDGRSEDLLGRFLTGDRDKIIVTTKFGHPSTGEGRGVASRAQVAASAETSLRRLRCDRIAFFLVHFPDARTPLEETIEALSRLICQGKILHYGVSNFSSEEIEQVVATADAMGAARPALIQDEYSLLHRSSAEKLLPVIESRRLAFVPFFPLASGLLTGRYRDNAPVTDSLRPNVVRRFSERFLHSGNFQKVEALRQLSDDNGVPMTQIAFQWLLQQPTVSTVLAGASCAEQLSENVEAVSRPVPAQLLDLAERATR